MKESNRHQADDIPEKLKAIGCDFVPVADPNAIELIEFRDDEIEVLAQLEHRRWNKEKFLAGWSYGKDKDPVRKTHPALVQWEALPRGE